MEEKPTLFIKASKSTLIIIAKYANETAEHEIQLKSILGYYWNNNLPVIDKLMELIETVIKRSINGVFPHEKLLIKYDLESNDKFEDSSSFKMILINVKADNTEINLEGNIIELKGIDSRNNISKITSFTRKDKKEIERII
ncbi:MAG: hypothetical protein LBM26_03210 [Methanobrevibacter sp.]|jgi:hypothetical protein|nr:hypothetical protein [Methanobrevibacter sp.]